MDPREKPVRNLAFLLKIGDDANPRNYRTIAGMWLTAETYSAERISINAGGIFLGSAAAQEATRLATSGEKAHFLLSFENGTKIDGQFVVAELKHTGCFNDEATYSIRLESVGAVNGPA